jgi:hypothetical protein
VRQVPSAQQGPPISPQRMQVPLLHSRPEAQVLLEQQPWPWAPQAPQVPLWQAWFPSQGAMPLPAAQQTSPGAPQWQRPFTQTPVGHMPPVTGSVRQAPASQRSWVQASWSLQTTQAAAPTPQATALVPGRQRFWPSTQPVQQAPPRQTPAGQASRSARGLCWQAPPSQISSVQGLSSLGQTQPEPSSPVSEVMGASPASLPPLPP